MPQARWFRKRSSPRCSLAWRWRSNRRRGRRPIFRPDSTSGLPTPRLQQQPPQPAQAAPGQAAHGTQRPRRSHRPAYRLRRIVAQQRLINGSHRSPGAPAQVELHSRSARERRRDSEYLRRNQEHRHASRCSKPFCASTAQAWSRKASSTASCLWRDISHLALPPEQETDSSNIPEDDQTMLNLVFLKYVTSSELMKVLQPFIGENASMYEYAPANLLLILDSRRNMRRMMDLVAHVRQRYTGQSTGSCVRSEERPALRSDQGTGEHR